MVTADMETATIQECANDIEGNIMTVYKQYMQSLSLIHKEF